LYPLHFVHRDLPESPFYILLHSWGWVETPRFLSDVIINIAIYVPLGMSAYLTLRRYGSRLLAIAGPIVLGTALSASVEMVQLYTPTRFCSMVDLVNNALGSAIGVVAGLLFARGARAWDFRADDVNIRDARAAGLLCVRFTALVFPFFPVISRFVWISKLQIFRAQSLFSVTQTALAGAEWFTTGLLLIAAGVKRPLRWLLFAALLLPLQLFILGRFPTPSDLIGAAVGIIAFHFFGKEHWTRRVAAAVLIAAIVSRGLRPFHLSSYPAPFAWMPFTGALTSEWHWGAQILVEKTFDYGTAIWLLLKAGVRGWNAVFGVTILLAAIEIVQMWLPAHAAEITDPLMGLLLGFLLTRPRLARVARVLE
jgi:VanZ family protein